MKCEKCGVEILDIEQFESSEWLSYCLCKEHFEEAKKLLEFYVSCNLDLEIIGVNKK